MVLIVTDPGIHSNEVPAFMQGIHKNQYIYVSVTTVVSA